jgi:hypothetical protein
MSRRWSIAVGALAIALTVAMTTAAAAPPRMFVTPLSGAEEEPARQTQGRGVAIFQLNPEGTELSYRLIASNIENVVAAHIHIGAPAVNGPVVAFLFGAVAPGLGRQNGVLATGTITASDLVGPLQGMPFEDLVDAITSGNAYVNVHTNDGIDPINTGAGDFPGGEIRGHLD